MNKLLEMDQFRLIFTVLFLITAVIRIYYHYKARIWQGNRTAEGALSMFFRACIGLPAILLMFIYLFWPTILAWASFPLAPIWRWVGAGIVAAALPLLVWIQSSLGKNYSSELRIRSDHNLVAAGPYRYVRHPMYTASLIIYTGMGLLTANWFIGAAGVISTLGIMIVRTPKEEAMLTKAFGDQYRGYTQRTGKFLPRFSPAARSASAAGSGQ
jgi:protein-S-isoprenylcysteine O-methyltransferase Ste14